MAELTRERIKEIRDHIEVGGMYSIHEIVAICDMALFRTPSPPLRQDQEELRRVIEEVERRLKGYRSAATGFDIHPNMLRVLLTAASLSLAPEPILTGEVGEMDRMVQIDKLIADMQEIREKFGNTCVYIRRGGLSWGAVALNRKADDEKHGVFDLQAQHDRDMTERLEQVQRLIADRDHERDLRRKFEAEVSRLSAAREAVLPNADELIMRLKILALSLPDNKDAAENARTLADVCRALKSAAGSGEPA